MSGFLPPVAGLLWELLLGAAAGSCWVLLRLGRREGMSGRRGGGGRGERERRRRMSCRAGRGMGGMGALPAWFCSWEFAVVLYAYQSTTS